MSVVQARYFNWIYLKYQTSPGLMHDTGCLGLVHWDDPEGWYGEGGGFRMGNICISVVDSFWYMAKPIQYCKVKIKYNIKNKIKYVNNHFQIFLSIQDVLRATWWNSQQWHFTGCKKIPFHCIFQIKIPIYEHLLMVYCRANSSSVGCWISDHTNVPWGCKDFFHDAVTKYI